VSSSGAETLASRTTADGREGEPSGRVGGRTGFCVVFTKVKCSEGFRHGWAWPVCCGLGLHILVTNGERKDAELGRFDLSQISRSSPVSQACMAQ
jgi:hypothetical protein